MIDTSGSIWFNNQGSEENPPDFQRQKEFIINVTNGFGGEVGLNGIRVGLIVFGTQATSEIYLNQFNDRTALVNFMSNIRYRGTDQRTNMVEAFELLRTDQYLTRLGDRPDVPNIAIIVTDGRQVRDHTKKSHYYNVNPSKLHGVIIVYFCCFGRKHTKGAILHV